MDTTYLSTVADLERDRRRTLVDTMRSGFEQAALRALSLKHKFDEWWFERQQLEADNPKFVRADAKKRIFIYQVIILLFGAYIIDVAILRAGLEFLLALMTANQTFIAFAIFLLPLGVLGMDVGFGKLIASAFRNWNKGKGVGQVVLWLPFALLWLSIMPLSMLANYDVVVGAGGEVPESFVYHRWALTLLALLTHGGIMLAGRRIHSAFALAWFRYQYRRLSRRIGEYRDMHLQAIGRAVSLFGDYQSAREMFNRDFPAHALGVAMVDQAALQLLAERAGHAVSVPGNISRTVN